MTKELEALNTIEKATTNWIRNYNDEKRIWEDVALDNSCQPEIDLIRKALTPPTADEVCKAIEEWYASHEKLHNAKIVYQDQAFMNVRNPNDIQVFCTLRNDGTIFFGRLITLKPDFLIMISRFYESRKEIK